MNLSDLKLAPITASERAKLRYDLLHIRETAIRKGLTLDAWQEGDEKSLGNANFELGCWLYFFSKTRSVRLEHRIECARRIFAAGISNPRYSFFTVFNFGERDFDNIFEMGDSAEVVAVLRHDALSNPKFRTAFIGLGLSIESNDSPSVFDLELT